MADNEKKSKEGSEKKARAFDFMAMFNEARQTAIERTQATREKEALEMTEAEKADEKVTKLSQKMQGTSSSGSSDSDSDSQDSSSDDDKGTQSNKKVKGKRGDSDSEVGPPLPPGFKAVASSSKEKGAGGDADDIGPPLPPGFAPVPSSTGESSGKGKSDTLQSKIPNSHEVILNHGSRTVSALGLDPSGARLVTGSLDYDVRFWDFAGMDASLQSFRTLRPCESHQIRALEYSTTGDVILVVAGNAQAKIIDRDGFEKCECVKGDQYLVDPASTKGHTGMLNAGCWNPKIREEFMTCSIDGTVRIWDITNVRRHKGIMKPKGTGGRRVIPTACAYSNDGRYMAAACQDGSIQLWDHNKHTFVSSDTSCLRYSYDGRVLASRGGDDTLKLWDLRNFKKPLQQVGGLSNMFPMTDCVFSPDDKMIITGTSMDRGDKYGKAIFFERETMNKVYEMQMEGASVVRCLWHPKLNQMVLGCGDGQVHLYYDPKKSHRGAMLCVVRKKRKAKQEEVVVNEHIITPYALPMFREGRPTSTRKQEEKVRKDPVKSHRPDLPVYGPGTGGRVGAKGATLSQYVAQSIASRKPDPYEKDPRGAILRHAKEAAENPYWIDNAYTKSQPVPIFQKPEDEKDEKDDDEPMWKKQKIG
ncbi:hypothetical protein BaRGS_00028906 [Batillaria attramentaria]|uniref:WD repeat-containing protein 70 n=1 Tax=Batillaria attramentaria TaxID=370345 RepID=A0ABD0JXP9_9CAEN